MSREVAYWVATRDDAPVPPRVRVRVFERNDGRCACCGRKILAGEAWECDHIIALINGGTHSEGNLQPLLTAHHRTKTKADVAIKSKIARTRARHLGIKRTSRPIPGSKASGIRKRMSGNVERWRHPRAG